MLLGFLLTLTNSCDTEVDPKLLPVLTTTEINKSTESTAYSGGNITSDAGSDVISRGVCWSESPNPTLDDNKTSDAAGTGVFTSRITRLNPSSTYYVRAYATNKKGTAYGLQTTFTTKTLIITTTPITAATISTALGGGTITTDGDSVNVVERGVCWSKTANPTLADSKIAGGKGKGKYTCSLTELQIETQYFVRAYATNTTGTFYGDEISFYTTNGSMTITTIAATSITAISATIGGNIPNDGGSPVTERGFCISKIPNPTITNKIMNGSGTGSFATNINGLEANTTYYVRAFATNSVATVYGTEISFTTKDGVISLTTIAATSITATSATIGGTITSDGGASITARGFCWSKNTNPTTGDSKSTSIGTVGSYSTNINSLNIGAIYYIRAYATNSVGTSYGNEVSFTTQNGDIVLTTTNPSSIMKNSAIFGGNITSDGGGVTVTDRGVCYSTSNNPTINDSKSSNGSGIGNFTSLFTGLSENTTYYVRAYATNIVGTYYSNELTFKTLPPSGGLVTDIDGNIYHTVTIGTQVWLVENLRTTKYNDGTDIPLVTNPSTWSTTLTPAYCWYNNDATAYKNSYGGLYNWYTIKTGKLAPVGWHIPTDSEFTILINYVTAHLGFSSSIAKSLASTNSWATSVNTGSIGLDLTVNNSSGFSALPGGSCNGDGSFNYVGKFGYWWSSTLYNSSYSWYYCLDYRSSNTGRYSDYKNNYGFSVRCIRD